MSTEGNISSNGTDNSSTTDEYDIPLFGIDTGTFYYLHITAVVCVISSLVCATLSIVFTCRYQSAKNFYTTWSKSDRFIVYIALCDSLFNVSHLFEHAQMVVTRDHVRPKELCEFYGFNLTMFVTAQILLVNIVAVNAFILMYFNTNLNFGRIDWKLLLYTLGVPFIAATLAGLTNQFGPAGFYCGPRGIIVLWLNTIPLIVILTINIVLYALTWKQIYHQTKAIGKSLCPNAQSRQASSRAARSMSLFVAAFYIQWGPLATYSVWALLTTRVPFIIVYFATISVNVGGCLNLGVFVLKRRSQPQESTTSEPVNVTDTKSKVSTND